MLAGYETVNRGRTTLYDGATLRNGNAAIYGGAVTLEVETFLTDRLVFLVRARERVLFGGEVGNFQFQLGAGIKFIIK